MTQKKACTQKFNDICSLLHVPTQASKYGKTQMKTKSKIYQCSLENKF